MFRRLISAALLLMTGGLLYGQTLSSEMEFSQGRTEYGSLEAGAEGEGGALHLAQEADKKVDLYLDASGEKQVGRFRMRGSFLFKQSFENGVRYASTFHPTRPMPYIIADSTGGNWRKQDYVMDVDISMPVIADRLSLGVAMGLEAGRGAKKTDPRPQAGICDISVVPSMSVNAGVAGVFSAGFSYGLYRESSDLILYDSSQPQKLYLLKGLGQYTYEVFSSSQRERKFEGHKLGGKFAWTKTMDGLVLDARGEYRNGIERVFDVDYSKPHDRGRYITHEYNATASALLERQSWGGEIALSYVGSHGSGREIIQHYESSSDVNSWVTDSENPARYTRQEGIITLAANAWLKDDAGNKTWKFGASLDRDNTVQQYKATSSYMRQDVLYFHPSVERDIYLNSGVILLGINGELSHLLSSRLDYTVREESDTNISEGLIRHDFYLPYNRYGFSANAGYRWNLKNGNGLVLKGHGSYVAGGSLCRWAAGLSLGYAF